MKTIRYTKEFTRPDGYPFYISNPDPAVTQAAIADAVSLGRTVASVPQVPADSFAQVIISFMNGMPHERGDKGEPVRKQTAEDFGNNYAVIKALRNVDVAGNKDVALADQVHTWLVKQVADEGPAFFGNSQPEVALRLNDIVPEKGTPETQ